VITLEIALLIRTIDDAGAIATDLTIGALYAVAWIRRLITSTDLAIILIAGEAEVTEELALKLRALHLITIELPIRVMIGVFNPAATLARLDLHGISWTLVVAV